MHCSQRTWSIILALGCLVQVSSESFAQRWVKHTYAGEGFEIDFHGAVEVTSQPTDDTVVFLKHYKQEGRDYSFAASSQLMKYADKPFERAVNAAVEVAHCRTESSEEIGFLPGWNAREYRGKDCNRGVSMQIRFFGIGKWFYTVIAAYKEDAEREREAQHFVSSFRHVEWQRSP